MLDFGKRKKSIAKQKHINLAYLFSLCGREMQGPLNDIDIAVHIDARARYSNDHILQSLVW